MVTVRMENVRLEICGYRGTCGSCSRAIKPNEGVAFGKFASPTCVNICKRCISIASALLGQDPVIMREGRG